MSRRKLLLADDSITIQKVVNLTFADEGIDVVTVGDGDAALAKLSEERPDILLADVNMPGPNGYEICERLRANDATRDLPVILLVGSFEPFDESEATRVGANAYLTKPFQSIRQLIEQVNQLMATAPEAEEPVVAAENPVSEATVERPADVRPTSQYENISAISPSPAPAPDSAVPRFFDDLGYATATPPGEPQVGSSAPVDDIDSLYVQSLSASEDEKLSDVGIDDEMIETSYSAHQASDIADYPSEPEPPIAVAPAEERKEEPEVGFRSGYDQRFPEDPSKFESTIAYDNWQPADMRGESAPTEPESGNVTAAEEPETRRSLETTRLDEPSPQLTEQTIPEDTIRMENRFDTAGSASYQFEDIDLLDLAAAGTDGVEITSPADALAQQSNKQVVTLSPELIEMIAQRVVEKLAEKY